MRKIDNDRVQSFHMQSQRRILGVKWYDKISNKGSDKDLYLPSSPIDVTHFLATSANYPGTHLFPKHYIYPLMPSPAHLATTLSQSSTAVSEWGSRLLNNRCTDSTLAISVAMYGEHTRHTWEAYPSSGLTYAMNVLSKVLLCLEWKHLKIKLALMHALLTILLTCWDNVNLSSIVSDVLYITDISVLNSIDLRSDTARQTYGKDAIPCQMR